MHVWKVCFFGSKLSLKDEREYQEMLSRMRYDTDDQCWWVKFDWTVPKKALVSYGGNRAEAGQKC